MVLLNSALLLPRIEVEALISGRSILACPSRFIAPGKRFALISSELYPGELNPKELYQEQNLKALQHVSPNQGEQIQVVAWAKCDFCKPFNNPDSLRSLKGKTLWKESYLDQILTNQSNLFIAFLRIHRIETEVFLDKLEAYESIENINGFVPISKYIDAPIFPIINDSSFQRKSNFINSSLTEEKPKELQASQAYEKKTERRKETESKNSIQPVTDSESTTNESQKDSEKPSTHNSDWYTKIAEAGNSSDGHLFEKLVRKAFLELGFSNSERNPKASLAPEATGGSGGVDIYTEQPFQLVGECKASKNLNVPNKVTGQLIQLGTSNLGKEKYEQSIKCIFAAGKLTSYANLDAKEHHVNVIRPETLQRLVELKRSYPGAIDLRDFKKTLETAPFGEDANHKVEALIKKAWDKLTRYSYIVEAVRNIEKAEGALEPEKFRMPYNFGFAKEESLKITSDREARDLLMELSSPLTAYIGRIEEQDGSERFYFLKSLEISD